MWCKNSLRDFYNGNNMEGFPANNTCDVVKPRTIKIKPIMVYINTFKTFRANNFDKMFLPHS